MHRKSASSAKRPYGAGRLNVRSPETGFDVGEYDPIYLMSLLEKGTGDIRVPQREPCYEVLSHLWGGSVPPKINRRRAEVGHGSDPRPDGPRWGWKVSSVPYVPPFYRYWGRREMAGDILALCRIC